MRPRHSLLLLSLAALPVVLAVLLVGNGSLNAPSGAAPNLPTNGRLAQVALELLGGGSARVPVNQCGKSRRYMVYPAQGSIRFIGVINPARHWKLTLKLKACYGGQFQSAGSVQAVVGPNGIYNGSFSTPIAGYYYARVEASRADRQVARSPKVYFEVR